MINELRENVRTELEIIKEMSDFIGRLNGASAEEERLLNSMISSYERKLKLINNSIPEILDGISLVPKIPSKKKEEDKIHNLEINPPNPDAKVKPKDNKNVKIAIRKQDKNKFLEELSISEELIKKLKKQGVLKKEKQKDYKKTTGYAHLSNIFFRSMSEKILDDGGFKSLRVDLRQSNMNILPTTYLSMSFMGILLSIILGVLVAMFFLFFNVGLSYPFIQAQHSGFIQRFLRVIGIAFAVPLITAIVFYFYPYTEKKSLGSRIDREIPFVAIHMSSISGSGIEPTQIFKILASSKEYVYTGSELRKLLNQINIYGYDLVTSLKNISRSTPSVKLAELFKGLATAIMTGGDLKSFLEKRAETLLLSYRLEREKFTKTAETFMDIYISVVIAAPMILLLLLVMISVSGISIGIGTGPLTLGIILIVAVINILFMILLGMKQPGY